MLPDRLDLQALLDRLVLLEPLDRLDRRVLLDLRVLPDQLE